MYYYCSCYELYLYFIKLFHNMSVLFMGNNPSHTELVYTFIIIIEKNITKVMRASVLEVLEEIYCILSYSSLF